MTSSSDFFPRFLTLIISSSVLISQILHRINACALQAVEAADRHVKLLNGHLKDFLLDGLFTFNHYLCILCLGTKVDEQIEMLIENLGSERNRLLSGDGAVSKNLECELIVIGIAADTGILNSSSLRYIPVCR